VGLGPVEVLVVRFPGNQFTGEIAPALAALVEQGTIRVIDLLFVTKDDAGDVEGFELTDVADEPAAAFAGLVHESTGLLSEEDVVDLGEDLEPNSSAAILVFEHTWATRFRDAVLDAGGELVTNVRIPKETVDEVLALRSGASG
jgi:hypothetical protein